MTRVKSKKKSGRPPEIPTDPDELTQIGPIRCRSKEKRYILGFVQATNFALDEFVVRAVMNEIKRLRGQLSELPEEPK